MDCCLFPCFHMEDRQFFPCRPMKVRWFPCFLSLFPSLESHYLVVGSLNNHFICDYYCQFFHFEYLMGNIQKCFSPTSEEG